MTNLNIFYIYNVTLLIKINKIQINKNFGIIIIIIFTFGKKIK